MSEHGGPEVLHVQGAADPVAGDGEVLIRVRAFGRGVTPTPTCAEIVDKAGRGVFAAKPVRVFRFEEIVEAHHLMDSGRAGGKLVVEVS